MRKRLQNRRNRRLFRSASRQAQDAGGMVCGTYDSKGRPVYFVMPKGTDDQTVSKAAFQHRNGRSQSPTDELFETYAREWLAKHRDQVAS